jgi:hypothetical protein
MKSIGLISEHELTSKKKEQVSGLISLRHWATIEKVKSEISKTLRDTIFSDGMGLRNTIKETIDGIGIPEMQFRVNVGQCNDNYISAQILVKPMKAVEYIILNVTMIAEIKARETALVRNRNKIWETCTKADIYDPEYVPAFVHFGDITKDWVIFDGDGKILVQAGSAFMMDQPENLISEAKVTEIHFKLVS